jgi:DNA-binding transcriptional LysR family regulator
MEFRHLKHIVALAEERNFRKAAERVNLTQPAFSRSIQAAEDEWAMKLFDRGGGAQVSLTPAGAFVMDRVRKLSLDWRSLERDVMLYRDREIGDLAIGMGPFTGATLLPRLVLELRNSHPGVRVKVQVTNPRHLLQCVLSEEHDFFFGDIRYALDNEAFVASRVGSQPGALYVRSGHPLLDLPSVAMADLVPFCLVTGRLPDEVQSFVLQLMGRTPQEGLPLAVECDEVNVLKSLALATDAILVGTPALVRMEVAAGQLRMLAPVDLPPTRSEVGVVSLRGRTLSPIATHAVAFLSRLLAEDAGAES